MPNFDNGQDIGMDEELRREYGNYGYKEEPYVNTTDNRNIGVDEENRRDNER